MNSNKAFSLFELILVIFISSIVMIFTFKFTQELNSKQELEKELLILKTDLLASKIIIEKNLPQIIEKLNYKNNTLYLDNNIFLKDVESFALKNEENKVKIEINLKNKISQTWQLKYEK